MSAPVVLVTGAAGGIGSALARHGLARGWRLALADIDLARAQSLAVELGGETLALPLDVRSETQWSAALDAVWARWGRLDILVNNAGIVRPGLARDVGIDDHRLTHEVNFVGPLTGMLAALPRMKAQGHGHLVTICSMSSFLPMTGLASYVASKHALRAFHHSLALEERGGPLRFTMVHPAATETPMLEQEAQVDATALAFSEPTLSADEVAARVLRAIDRRESEVVMPAFFGRVLRWFGAQAGIVGAVLGYSEAKGREALMRRRKSPD